MKTFKQFAEMASKKIIKKLGKNVPKPNMGNHNPNEFLDKVKKSPKGGV